MDKKVELLAPVGSIEALKAAVENGADAVYFGGKNFSARQYANNFSDEELAEAIKYAHLLGSKVFITINTLMDDSELPALVDFLGTIHQAGADAVIIQDIGLASLIKENFPGLALHASTQMTVHNSEGVKLLEELGFERVVLAREVSLEEIKKISEETSIEIEVFVHGALCICYSGQCLMSSFIGGRSGNRGRCAQPCRLEYTLVDANGKSVGEDKGKYLLSPKDLRMIEHLPELIEAGVASLKIEGRMKRPEYVATVTRIYRKVLDEYYRSAGEYRVTEQEKKNLKQIFNRDFTTGYFFGKQGAELMSYKRPNNRGLLLGRVVTYKHPVLSIKLDEALRIGDGIEVWVTTGGRVGMTVNEIKKNGKKVEMAAAGDTVELVIDGKIRQGDRIFKTYDVELMSKTLKSFDKATTINRVPLKADVLIQEGKSFKLILEDDAGNKAEAESDFITEQARKTPLSREQIEIQLGRTGTTVFAIEEFKLNMDDNIMVPVSELNKTRRKAIEILEEKRLQNWDRERINVEPIRRDLNKRLKQTTSHTDNKVGRADLTVRVGSLYALEVAAKAGAAKVYFGRNLLWQDGPIETYDNLKKAQEIAAKHETLLYLDTPRIIHEGSLGGWEELIDFVVNSEVNGVLVANLGILNLLKGAKKAIIADFPLNTYNSLTLDFFSGYNVEGITLSPELNLQQVTQMAKLQPPVELECLVHGELPMMISAYCAPGSLQNCTRQTGKEMCRRRNCFSRGFALKDRMGMHFPLHTMPGCGMEIENPKELCMIEHLDRLVQDGIKHFRIECSHRDEDYVKTVTTLYKQQIDLLHSAEGRKKYESQKEQNRAALEKLAKQGITKGHYFRGVL